MSDCTIAFLAILLMYALITKVVSIGGWGRLFADYPDTSQSDDRKWKGASAHIGSAFYRHVYFADDSDGLHLYFSRFTPFHRPLFIPWTAIKCEPIKKKPHYYDTGQFVRCFVSTSGGHVPLEIEDYNNTGISKSVRLQCSEATAGDIGHRFRARGG